MNLHHNGLIINQGAGSAAPCGVCGERMRFTYEDVLYTVVGVSGLVKLQGLVLSCLC
jgi:hypothetical protein